jgi:hypothetical protein
LLDDASINRAVQGKTTRSVERLIERKRLGDFLISRVELHDGFVERLNYGVSVSINCGIQDEAAVSIRVWRHIGPAASQAEAQGRPRTNCHVALRGFYR